MHRRARLIAILACLVFLAAASCASEDHSTDPTSAPRADASNDASTPGPGKDDRGKGGKSGGKNDGGKNTHGAGEPGASGGSGNGNGGSSDPDLTEGANENDNSTPIAPAEGTYTYSQQGFEEFCQTSCERSRLPSTADTKIKVQERSGSAVFLTSETRSSDDRLVRSTFIYTPDKAMITRLYARFAYKGFTLTEQYDPNPAIYAFNFPLEGGAGWQGHWDAKVSGDYAVSVAGDEQVSVSGATVRAMKVETNTTFSGEYDGEAHIVAWIDPATRAVVRASGEVDLKSTFGRYHTRFTTTLRSGPGY
jgi:hypothetical protein